MAPFAFVSFSGKEAAAPIGKPRGFFPLSFVLEPGIVVRMNRKGQ